MVMHIRINDRKIASGIIEGSWRQHKTEYMRYHKEWNKFLIDKMETGENMQIKNQNITIRNE